MIPAGQVEEPGLELIAAQPLEVLADQRRPVLAAGLPAVAEDVLQALADERPGVGDDRAHRSSLEMGGDRGAAQLVGLQAYGGGRGRVIRDAGRGVADADERFQLPAGASQAVWPVRSTTLAESITSRSEDRSEKRLTLRSTAMPACASGLARRTPASSDLREDELGRARRQDPAARGGNAGRSSRGRSVVPWGETSQTFRKFWPSVADPAAPIAPRWPDCAKRRRGLDPQATGRIHRPDSPAAPTAAGPATESARRSGPPAAAPGALVVTGKVPAGRSPPDRRKGEEGDVLVVAAHGQGLRNRQRDPAPALQIGLGPDHLLHRLGRGHPRAALRLAPALAVLDRELQAPAGGSRTPRA